MLAGVHLNMGMFLSSIIFAGVYVYSLLIVCEDVSRYVYLLLKFRIV